jgi:Na+-transporting NADH:ubiquinone oxidoreductase subunit F
MQKKSFTLNINSGKRNLNAVSGETIFEAFKRQDFYLPSACSAQGKCGLCRLRILNNPTAPLEQERKFISASDLESGYRLACQTVVDKDLQLELPASYYSIAEYEVKITKKEFLTADIVFIECQAVEPKLIRLVAGCFLQWELPVEDQNGKVCKRPFSLASNPANQRKIEFFIRRNPCGIATKWIFENAKVGDVLKMRGPGGGYQAKEDDRELIFIAGGSGLSAPRSILFDMINRKIKRKCTLFFGIAGKKDLFMDEEMRAMQDRLEDFRYIPALSNAQEEDNWQGEAGLISDVVKRHYESFHDKEVYLCGSPAMIEACRKMLLESNVAEDAMYFDKFTSSC